MSLLSLPTARREAVARGTCECQALFACPLFLPRSLTPIPPFPFPSDMALILMGDWCGPSYGAVTTMIENQGAE